MFKNRVLVVIGVVSLLLVTMAVSLPLPNASLTTDQGASDFYQRHPDWTWTIHPQNASIPVTSDLAFPDYYQRHLQLRTTAIPGLTASDYFQRHPELNHPAEARVDMTDYYFRHPAQR